MKLLVCRQCGRHVKSVESACPFCGVRRANPSANMAAAAALAVGLGIAVAACGGTTDTDGGGGMVGAYGPPPDAAADVADDGGDADAGSAVMYGPASYDAAAEAEEEADVGTAFLYGPAPVDGAYDAPAP